MDQDKVIYDAVMCLNPEGAEKAVEAFKAFNQEEKTSFLLSLIERQNNNSKLLVEGIFQLGKAFGINSVDDLPKTTSKQIQFAGSLVMKYTMNKAKIEQQMAGFSSAFKMVENYKHLLPEDF